jgi:hypothetical protein
LPQSATLKLVNTTNFWSQFQWFISESLSVARIPPFRYPLVVLYIGLIVSAIWQKPFQRKAWKPQYWLVFTQLFFVPAVCVIGVIYRVTPDPTKPLLKENAVADWSINVLALLSALSIFLWVYRMKGIRWVVFCILAIQEVFVLGAMFMAGMSISGDWI